MRWRDVLVGHGLCGINPPRHEVAAVAASLRRDLTMCRFVGVPPAIIIPRLTTYEHVVDGICRPGSLEGGPASSQPEVAGDRISRLHSVRQLQLR